MSEAKVIFDRLDSDISNSLFWTSNSQKPQIRLIRRKVDEPTRLQVEISFNLKDWKFPETPLESFEEMFEDLVIELSRRWQFSLMKTEIDLLSQSVFIDYAVIENTRNVKCK